MYIALGNVRVDIGGVYTLNPLIEYWVWLTLAFGPANPRKWNAVSHYGSVSQVYKAVREGRFDGISTSDRSRAEAASLEQASELIKYCFENGIRIYCNDDPDFPDRLREIYNPPSVLFAYGSLDGVNDRVVISSVGTRKPSEYSIYVTERICSELAKSGVIIASGIAVGLDSVSIRSAISSRGKVICVLPCGLECSHPKENANSKALISRHGAVISEYLPNEKPSPVNFHARNRLIAGISLGTLITQAGLGSGSLSTARFASEQGRDIFCIPPHELFDESYSGVVGLLRDGAIPVFDAADILNEYYSVYAHKLDHSSDTLTRKNRSWFIQEDEQPKRKVKVRKSDPEVDNALESCCENEMPDMSGLSSDKKRIIEFVFRSKTALFDEIASELSDVNNIETLLTELELDGYIKAMSGNRYTI